MPWKSVVGACDWPEDVDLNPTCSVEERQEPFGRDTQRRNLKRKAHINCGNNTRGDKHLAPSGPNEQMTSNDFPFMIWFYRRELFDRNTTVQSQRLFVLVEMGRGLMRCFEPTLKTCTGTLFGHPPGGSWNTKFSLPGTSLPA